jgi:hypothetical protein
MTPKQAVAHARDLTGLTSEQADVKADEAELRRRMVPFIDPPPGGRVWVVRFSNMRRGPGGSKAPPINPFVRPLTVYLVPETGQILQAVSDGPPDQPAGSRFPSAEEQEEQMIRINQTFTRVPSEPPRFTLVKAIERAVSAGVAKQIIAYYVEVQHKSTGEIRPVWMIHAWGIPPFEPIGTRAIPRERLLQLVPESARNHLRSEIDAQTGELYGFDTIPQPMS